MVDLVVEDVVDRKYYYRDQNGNLLLDSDMDDDDGINLAGILTRIKNTGLQNWFVKKNQLIMLSSKQTK